MRKWLTETIRIALCVLSLVTATLATSAELRGVVVGVTDGDTIMILDASKQHHRIRINGIDAPEYRQAFGERSKQNLSRMAFQKDAQLDCHKTDRYGRKVCKVWVQPGDCPICGKTLDVGLAQITDGMAWWYRRFADEQSPEDQGRYESAEKEAKLRKWGLWQDKQPVPPWEFRRKK